MKRDARPPAEAPMTHFAKISTLAGIFVFLCASSCGKTDRNATSEASEPRLDRYDLDKDGKISKDEKISMNQEFVGRFDLNDDGELDSAERERLRKMAKASVAPVTTILPKQAADSFISRIDRNRDGNLTAEEVDEKRWQVISRADSDGDGKVTADEWAGRFSR